MATTNHPRQCPQCGTTLTAAAVEWLCPRCLLGQAATPPGAVESGLAPRWTASNASESTPAPLRSVLHHFGDYELIEEIARGGMGVVYRARQISLDRIVAVKMLQFGRLAAGDVLKRFRQEAEAIASLRHPNIVPIHEFGEHDGQPYFSMDLIEGGDLGVLVRDRALAGRHAAGLLRTIAEAVSYSHEHGILHRDLKPTNILLDGDGQPHLTDFGLAKFFELRRDESSTSDTGRGETSNGRDWTATGQVVGTPSYMSPEQAGGRRSAVGVVSDVYSLGAVLYFLVTGRAPFPADTLEEFLRLVHEAEPVSPRRLNVRLGPDLESICLKCLEKDPDRRYASARALGEDLDRFLRGEPIRARPLGPSGKVWRWCRRKPALAASLVAIGLLLLTVAVGSTVAAVRLDRARGKAVADEREQSRLREIAEAESARSRQVTRFLEEMLRRVEPGVAMGRDTQLLREILDAAAQRIGTELTNQPAVEASLRGTIGRAYNDLGLYAQAHAMFTVQLELLRALHGTEHEAVLPVLNDLAGTLKDLGRRDEMGAMFTEGLSIARRRRGTNSLEAADALTGLAGYCERRGEYTRGEAMAREALEIYRRRLGESHRSTARPRHQLANLLRRQKRLVEAESELNGALAIYRQHVDELWPRLASGLEALAVLREEAGRYDEALPPLDEALTVIRRAYAEDHPNVAVAKFYKGDVLRRRGHPLEEAERLFRETLPILQKKWRIPAG